MKASDGRLTVSVDRPLRAGAECVLYWMTAQRRPRWNPALEHAISRARELALPLVVLEPLSCSYRWASRRHHSFLLEGMEANREAFEARGVGYHGYVEPAPGAGSGLLPAWADRAAVIVADDHPGELQSSWLERGCRGLPVRVEAVDGCGLLPRRHVDSAFKTAHSFRRLLQAQLPQVLSHLPAADPLVGANLPPASLPVQILERWPDGALDPKLLPIDQAVGPCTLVGGWRAAAARLGAFVREELESFGVRGDPLGHGHSGLSPWLHHGHLSAHEILAVVGSRFGWCPADLEVGDGRGSRTGWWGLPGPAEAFIEQVATWRELSFNGATHTPDSPTYTAQPDWAKRTLEEHCRDPRPALLELTQLEEGGSPDPLWNACQNQLREDGTIHSYLRMAWGKRLLEWTKSPEEAFEYLVNLNDRWALDGRDPISYASIGWVLGRYDRAWGPERPIFGKVRYMTSANTARKLKLAGYLERYGERGNLSYQP